MADVDFELNTIVSGRYGSDIRMAIHDALQKINNDSSSAGGGGGSGPVGDVKLALEGYDSISTSGFCDYRSFEPVDFVQDSSSTARASASVTQTVLGTHVVLGIIAHTGTVTVSSAGWTHEYTSSGVVRGTTKMMISVYKKTATYEDVTLAVTSESSEVICLKIIVLNQNENITSKTASVSHTKYYNIVNDSSDAIYLAAAIDNGSPSFTINPADGATAMSSGQFEAFYVPKNSGEKDIYYYTQTVPEEGFEVVKLLLT